MGEFFYRARIALFVCAFTMISAVPATWTTEIIDSALKGLETLFVFGQSQADQTVDSQADLLIVEPDITLEQGDGGTEGWAIAKWTAYLMLLGASVGLAYLTAQAIGAVAAEVVGSDTMEKVDILMLPVSKQIRDPDMTQDRARTCKDLLEALVNGRATLMRTDAGLDDPRVVPTFASMTAPDTKIVLDKESVLPSAFSWQQSWRTIREQIDSGKLSEIVLVKSASAMDGETEREFRSFRNTLEFLIKNEQGSACQRFGTGQLKITERTPSNNGIEAIQELYHKVVKASAPGQRVGIDITSGDRIYAFAAGLSALHEKAVMFYVSTTDTDGERHEQPKVACYDVRPKFRSS